MADSTLSLNQFETLNTRHYLCPACGTADRNRLCALLLQLKLPRKAPTPFKLLDIAPSVSLANFIKRGFDVKYRSADLQMAGVDDHIDITDMRCYADDEFDAVLCSHVLEHVGDDLRAIREMHRIMKPGGWGMILVPIHLGVEMVIEESVPLSATERSRRFGQSDHVRLYGRLGFMDRLTQGGFTVARLGIDHFGARAFRTSGISPTSAVYLASKPRND